MDYDDEEDYAYGANASNYPPGNVYGNNLTNIYSSTATPLPQADATLTNITVTATNNMNNFNLADQNTSAAVYGAYTPTATNATTAYPNHNNNNNLNNNNNNNMNDFSSAYAAPNTYDTTPPAQVGQDVNFFSNPNNDVNNSNSKREDTPKRLSDRSTDPRIDNAFFNGPTPKNGASGSRRSAESLSAEPIFNVYSGSNTNNMHSAIPPPPNFTGSPAPSSVSGHLNHDENSFSQENSLHPSQRMTPDRPPVHRPLGFNTSENALPAHLFAVPSTFVPLSKTPDRAGGQNSNNSNPNAEALMSVNHSTSSAKGPRNNVTVTGSAFDIHHINITPVSHHLSQSEKENSTASSPSPAMDYRGQPFYVNTNPPRSNYATSNNNNNNNNPSHNIATTNTSSSSGEKGSSSNTTNTAITAGSHLSTAIYPRAAQHRGIILRSQVPQQDVEPLAGNRLGSGAAHVRGNHRDLLPLLLTLPCVKEQMIRLEGDHSFLSAAVTQLMHALQPWVSTAGGEARFFTLNVERNGARVICLSGIYLKSLRALANKDSLGAPREAQSDHFANVVAELHGNGLIRFVEVSRPLVGTDAMGFLQGGGGLRTTRTLLNSTVQDVVTIDLTVFLTSPYFLLTAN